MGADQPLSRNILMAKIPADHLGSVVMLLEDGVATGTAFLLRHRIAVDDPLVSTYLVTCEHCTYGPNEALLADASSFPLDEDEWVASPTGADVAAMDVSHLVSDKPKLGFVQFGDFVLPEDTNFGVGSDLYMLGLFADGPDLEPRARFGNISSMSPRQMPDGGPGVHLGDMRSRSGFSGSPVFAFELLSAFGGLVQRAALLGVHKEQYHEDAKVWLAGESEPRDALFPASMTVIEPSWELEFIDTHERLLAKRANRRQPQ